MNQPYAYSAQWNFVTVTDQGLLGSSHGSPFWTAVFIVVIQPHCSTVCGIYGFRQPVFFIDLHIQRRNIQTWCPKYHTIQDFNPDALTGWGFWVISPGEKFCVQEGGKWTSVSKKIDSVTVCSECLLPLPLGPLLREAYPSHLTDIRHGHVTCSGQWAVRRSSTCQFSAEAWRASPWVSHCTFRQPQERTSQRRADPSAWIPEWRGCGAESQPAH